MQRRPYAPRMALDARREQLLDAALQVVARDGYAAVSIEAIAREAGVTRPVVYRVFDDLNALLFALLDRQEERALERLLATISLDPGSAEDVDLYVAGTIRELIAMVTGDPLLWRPILLAQHGTPAAVRTRIDRDRELVRRRVQTLVELSFRLRPPAPGLDPKVLAHMLVAVAEHYGRLLLEEPGAVDVDGLAGTVTALLAGTAR